jgi:hypothetical protein
LVYRIANFSLSPGTGLTTEKQIFPSFKFYYMPFLNAPSCNITGCTPPAFPVTTGACTCDVAVGGINDLYFIPCTETMSEANVTDVSWWQDLLTAETLGKLGAGLGSIAQGAVQTARTASCRTEQIINITWNLTYQILCMDKTSARSTQAKGNEIINRFDKYLLIARMCDGDETVLPVGVFTPTSANWTVPDNTDENQVVELVLSWKEKALPTTVDVAGLNLILPKAA